MGTRWNVLTSDPVTVLKSLSWAGWKLVRKSVLKLVCDGHRGMVCYVVKYTLYISVLSAGVGQKLSPRHQEEDGCSTKQMILWPSRQWPSGQIIAGKRRASSANYWGEQEAIIPRGGSSPKVRGRFSFSRQPQPQLVAQKSSSSMCCLHSKRAGMAGGSCGDIPPPWAAIGDPSAGWRRHCKEGREAHSHQSLCAWNTTGSGAKM